MANMMLIAAGMLLPGGGQAVAKDPEPVDVNVVNDVPVVEQVRGHVSHQLVGYTTAETEANIGIGGMTELCQAEIPDSRICSTREILESVDPIPPITSTSWVLGEYEILPNPTSATLPFLWREKYSGNGEAVELFTALRIGCEQFITPSSDYRTVVYGGSTGIFFRTSCNGTRPVACCAPRFVPAGP